MIPVFKELRLWRVLFTRNGYSDHEIATRPGEFYPRLKIQRYDVAAASPVEARQLAEINCTISVTAPGMRDQAFPATVVAVKPFVRLAAA